MADSTIPLTSLFLMSNRKGLGVVAQPEGPMTSTAAGHNTVGSKFQVGSRINGFNTGQGNGTAGPWSLVYGQMGTQNTTGATGSPVCNVGATAGGTISPFKYSNDSTGSILDPNYSAIMVAGMTDTYYGWFWDDGVCPDFMASSSTGSALSAPTNNGGVLKGNFLTVASGTSSTKLTLTPLSSLVVTVTGTAAGQTGSATLALPMGQALAADV